ncbi:DUF4124 domain-containing protein [Cupriavidus agavae]|uniref:Uncharacterized protein DUF4124 n=1 Tax=Cupriavidus agavae TaxID=1001822 RepID=A0A4Q7S6L4_9BURK|nr:DUF4124 domain-containing protein [Cupriavidus agavae]RZT42021.1 uncharacterized protein DUF4124 [Cupriavidus agavae]
MKRSSVPYPLVAALFAALTALAAPGTAFSQWQWKDANGRTVYSDVPPPLSVPASAIQAAPGRIAGAYRPVEDEAGTAEIKSGPKAAKGEPRMQPVSARAATDKPAKAGDKPATPDEAFRERRDARIKADLEAATKERQELARQERCQEMRNYATGLSQGMRVSRAGADGTAQRLNDDERAAELARTNESMSQHCTG